ncbi:hypothetical protein GCM10010252_19440 [Streptomyces aureoverticillatus]|nr:hypothetical protein GCM10010252_19440 [Streptomyces aureoverticillatus]
MIRADLPKRPQHTDVTELTAAIARREFWRLAPEETSVPDWVKQRPDAAPVPVTTPPTRALLERVEAGLQRRLAR